MSILSVITLRHVLTFLLGVGVMLLRAASASAEGQSPTQKRSTE